MTGVFLVSRLQARKKSNVSVLLSDIKKSEEWSTIIGFRLRKFKQGVPLGGILSPLLFNFFIWELPPPPVGVLLISFVVDCVWTGY